MLSNAGIHPRMRHLARSWMMIVGMVAQVGGAALASAPLAPRGALRAVLHLSAKPAPRSGGPGKRYPTPRWLADVAEADTNSDR
jgi:hypothetical protein